MDDSASNPQLARNLVLGTWAANGHMIQFENFIKDVLQRNSSASIDLTATITSLLPIPDGVTSPTWLSSRMRYQTHGFSPWGPIDFEFSLFSLFLPTRLETKIDKFLLKHPSTVPASSPVVQSCELKPTSTSSTYNRRLLESDADVATAATDVSLSASLRDLIPGVDTSALSSYVLTDVEVSEGWIYIGDISDGLLPALFVNGSFSLDAYPFNRLGLHGEVSLSVTAYPWFGSQFGLELPPAPFQLVLEADYEMDLSPVSGVVLRDVYLIVSVAPIPLVSSRSVIASFSVGGTAEIDLPGQSTPLTVSAQITLLEGDPTISFRAAAENWQNAFGVTGLTIDSVDLGAEFGGGSDSIELIAYWSLVSGSSFVLYGEKSGDFLAVGVQAANMSLADVGEIFQDVFGGHHTRRIERARTNQRDRELTCMHFLTCTYEWIVFGVRGVMSVQSVSPAGSAGSFSALHSSASRPHPAPSSGCRSCAASRSRRWSTSTTSLTSLCSSSSRPMP